MHSVRVLAAAAVFAGLLALAGCSDNTSGEVSGRVIVDGTPVEEGAVNFWPVDSKSQPSGGVIKDGTYSFKAPVGAVKVTLSKVKVTGTKKLYPGEPKSPEMPIKEEALPPRFNKKETTELTYEVRPGRNSKDWELSTK